MRCEIESFGDLKNLQQGLYERCFKEYLSRAIADALDRPTLKTPRAIAVRLLLTPVVGNTGALESISLEIEMDGRIPKVRSRPFSTANLGTKGLVYNDLSPSNVNQGTLELDKEKE